MELLRTDRLLLRYRDESGREGRDRPGLATTGVDNAASQRVAARLGMTDEGVTGRWFGLVARRYRKVISLLDS